MPGDGNKNKTWGPSTVHGRERGHLPELCPTNVSSTPPQFSKSAPNLDKSRAASGSTSLGSSSGGTAITARDYLGKSDEMLNRPKRRIATMYNNNNNIDDDDDDDNDMNRGCFAFIRDDDDDRTHTTAYLKPKKFSLDSTLDHQRFISGETDEVSPQPTYDRGFYRNVQKSLDNIFGGESFVTALDARQTARNSKSSGDLTGFNEKDEDTYGYHRFHPFAGDSKFDRNCFFTANNRSSGGTTMVNEIASSTDSSNHMDDSFRSMNLSGGQVSRSIRSGAGATFDERKNSICSDQSIDSVSMSRKSSVTFRSNVDSMSDYSFMSDRLLADVVDDDDDDHYEDSIADDGRRPTPTKRPTKSSLRNHNNNSINSNMTEEATSANSSTSSTRSKKKKEKSRIQIYLEKLFPQNKRKSIGGSSSSPSNSFYGKFDRKSEMSEQLLASDDSVSTVIVDAPLRAAATIAVAGSGGMGAVADEPQYDAIFRTRNFVLAKPSD